jgi:O-antigen/teichoic acid export membrane protein
MLAFLTSIVFLGAVAVPFLPAAAMFRGWLQARSQLAARKVDLEIFD